MPDPATLRGAAAEGLRGLGRTAPMVFPLYLANLAVALFAVLPLYLGLHRLTAHAPAAGRLATAWDLELLAELAMDHPALISQLQAAFVFAPIAYVLLSQLLYGGALGALARRERPTGRAFGGDALEHLWPFLRLLAWASLPYGLAALALVLGWALAEEASWPWRVVALLPGLALLAWVDAALDFARARRVLGGEGSAVRWLLTGFALVLRRPLPALGLHLGFGLAGLLPLGLLALLPDTLDAGGAGALLLAFSIRQIVLIARVALRVASLGAHLAFLDASPPRAAAAAAPAPLPLVPRGPDAAAPGAGAP